MESWIRCMCVVLVGTLTVEAGDGTAPSYVYSPDDVTSSVGNAVNFTCGIRFASGAEDDRDTIRWSRIVDIDSPFGEVIFTYHLDEEPVDTRKYVPYGKLDKLTLQVNYLEFEDAGIYVCEMIKFAKKATANLVVLDTPVPITPGTIVKADSVAQLSCEATFAGPREDEISEEQMPRMQTYLDTTKLTVKEEVFPGLPGTKWWVMKQTADVTVSDKDDAKELICSVETSNPYYHLDSRRPISVQHPVSLVEVQNVDKTYYVGDVINCTANGNPEPTYEWQPITVPQMTGSRSFKSPHLELTSNLIGTNTWKCVVSNMVGEKVILQKEITFEVEPSPYDAQSGESKSGGSSSVAIALGVVIPIVVIGIVLLVGFLVYRHRANKETSGKKTPDVPKELPPNPRPPGHMKVVPPQVYDPEEVKKNGPPADAVHPEDPEAGTPFLEEEVAPARPPRPVPHPRNTPPPLPDSPPPPAEVHTTDI